MFFVNIKHPPISASDAIILYWSYFRTVHGKKEKVKQQNEFKQNALMTI